MTDALLIDNDNVIKMIDLVDDEGTPQNDAVVKVTLLDSDGNNVAGQTWPLLLSYVDGSNGHYRGVLKYTLGLSHGQSLEADVDVAAGGLRYRERRPVIAEINRGSSSNG